MSLEQPLKRHTSLLLILHWTEQVTWIAGVKWGSDVKSLTERVIERYDGTVAQSMTARRSGRKPVPDTN